MDGLEAVGHGHIDAVVHGQESTCGRRARAECDRELMQTAPVGSWASQVERHGSSRDLDHLRGDLDEVGSGQDLVVGDDVEPRLDHHSNRWPTSIPRPLIQSEADIRFLPGG